MGLRLIAVALATILGLGCFVLDELDASEKLLKKPGFSSEQKKKQHDPAPEQARAAPESVRGDRPSVGEWWKKSRSITSGKIDESLVRCELGGSTQFMRRPDCLARGGTPRQAGG